MLRTGTIAILGAAMLGAAPALAQTSPPASGEPRATPVGNPGDWFPADAYPAEAKAAGMQGRTAFSLNIDDKGRVTGCNITSSSGSPLLDSTTCMLLVTNAHFKPAHDAAGQPVPGVWSSAMVWKLAAAAPTLPEGIGTPTGKSAAELYNEAVSAETKQQSAQSEQGQGHGQADDR